VAKLHVEVVSPEREVWTGEADEVFAKTLEGEIGILPQHIPVLSSLVDGSVVRIKTEDGEVAAAVGSGFLSVTAERVAILAEMAELGTEIDTAAARRDLQSALTAADEGDEDEKDAAAVAERRARARLRAAGQDDQEV
jgi:F-type H+-transporting ATPase subunit epsilon